MALNGISKSHYLWAVLCAIGYWGLIVPGVMMAIGISGIIVLWSVLSIIGITGMWMWVPKAPLNMKVFYTWVAVAVLGLAINALQFYKILSIPNVNYGFVWFLVTAIGFAATGFIWPKAKEAYYAGAVLNILCLVGMFVAKGFVGPNTFALLGIASVLPLAYAAMKN